MFGGQTINEIGLHYLDDLFIISYSDNAIVS